MVFQKPNPFPKSIYDNVAWAPRNLGLRRGLDERVEQALRGAALWDEVKDRLKDSALGLSGGQQQRLCIARAIAIEPDVLLLDEPASALDPIATGAIEDLMHSLKGRFTIVIVTHNMQQAARVADRTAFFSLETERREAGRDADRVRRDRDDLRQPARPAHPRLRHRPLRLERRARRDAGPQLRRISSPETCASSGLPHCQQKVAPLECGAPQPVQAPAVPVSSMRRIRSTSLSSASASCSGDRALDDHLDVDAVADGHLVDEAAEVPLQLGHPGDELLAAALEVDDQLLVAGGAHSKKVPSNLPLLPQPATPGSHSPPSCCSGGAIFTPGAGSKTSSVALLAPLSPVRPSPSPFSRSPSWLSCRLWRRSRAAPAVEAVAVRLRRHRRRG